MLQGQNLGIRQRAGTRFEGCSNPYSIARRLPLLRSSPPSPHPCVNDTSAWHLFSVGSKAPWCSSSSLLQSRVHVGRLRSLPSVAVNHVAASQSLMSTVPQLDSTSSSSRSSGPGDGPPRRDSDEYYANFGEAVKVLREDLPLLFCKDLRWHIYREDITFR
jgi:hypothetical protein